MKSIRSLYKKLLQYVPDKRIWAYFSMALSAAAVCSYMGAYWFLWQSIVSILVIPVYEKAMYDAIIVVILMILRGILFVQNGKVVEQGTHNELMACNGRYKDFQDVYCKANQWRLA